MKLLSTLKDQPADNCFILTYNLDLSFFEYMLFMDLYVSGCRNVVIFCDPTQYQKSLHDISILRFLGQRYTLVPARISPQGAFHPKLIFLSNNECGNVFITSGNLTHAGYNHNLEVASHVRYSARKPDNLSWHICNWAYQTLREISSRSRAGDIASQRLDQLYGTSSWLREPPLDNVLRRVWPIHNLELSLFDQLMDLIKYNDSSGVDEISIISPFFDKHLRAASTFVERLAPKKFTIFSRNPIGLDPSALSRLSDRSGANIIYKELSMEQRRLHGKVMMIKTGRGCWLVSGSANMSSAAWLKEAKRGNMEIVTLRYEPNQTYFDPWLAEVTKDARKIRFQDISYYEIEEQKDSSIEKIRLNSAQIKRKQLILQLDTSTEQLKDIKIFLNTGLREFSITEYYKMEDTKVYFEIDPQMQKLLESPTVCRGEIVLGDGEKFMTSSVVIINQNSLTRFSRPVQRKERPKIPDGLEPDSYEHCVQLISMMEDLLARDKEGLEKHTPRIGKRNQRSGYQAEIETDEKYDPEDHFVDEPIRVPERSAGDDFYVDYYDRRTYLSLLNAMLSVTYRPSTSNKYSEMITDVNIEEEGQEDEKDNGKKPETTTAKKYKKKIGKRIKTLVQRLILGIQDEKYLEEIPPLYLVELFLIILHFLKIIWIDGYLSASIYYNQTYDLFKGFLGYPGEEGAWSVLGERMHEPERKYAEDRLGFSTNVWLVLYLMGNLLKEKEPKLYFELSSLARHGSQYLQPPYILKRITKQELKNKWQFTFPEDFEEKDPHEINLWLENFLEDYNESTLITEIVANPAARAEIEYKNISDIDQVPSLIVKFPLSEASLNLCFEYFKIFLEHPEKKSVAWAQFVNVNPPISDDDIGKVIIFYREDMKRLEFVVERARFGEYNPDITKDQLNIDELLTMETYEDLM